MALFDFFSPSNQEDDNFLKKIGRSARSFASDFVNDAVKPAAGVAKDFVGDYVDKAVKPAVGVAKGFARDYVDEAVTPAFVKTGEYISPVTDIRAGRPLTNDSGEQMLLTDLPLHQQVVSAAVAPPVQFITGLAGSTAGLLASIEWRGVEKARPIEDKVRDWQKVIAVENPTFGDKLVQGLGSMSMFFIPGMGIARGSAAIGTISPRLALLFGNSAATALEAMTEAGDVYREAQENGVSKADADDKATRAFWQNAVLIGLTNRLGLFSDKFSGGIKKMIATAPFEAVQEFGQTVISNVQLGREWDEGAYESGLIGFILGGLMGSVDLGFTTTEEGQTRIVDQKVIKPEFIQSRLNDVAGKVGYILSNGQNFNTDTPLGRKILALQENELAHVDSPGQFYREVATVLKQDPAFKPEMLSVEAGLAGTTKDFFLQLKADPALYQQIENEGMGIYETAKEQQALRKLATKFSMPYEQVKKIVIATRGFIKAAEAKGNEDRPEIFQEALSQAQAEAGQMPNAMKEALVEARRNVAFPAEAVAAQQPEQATIYHMTNNDADTIRDEGFAMGRNSAFGEAAFFSEQPRKTYGENQLNVDTKDFTFRTFRTVEDQQNFIREQGAKNLADAVRTEGTFDGFIIPNQDQNIGTTFGITNKEKLDTALKRQQFITTEEARKLSKNFRFIEELDIPLNVKRKMLTLEGREAYGSYYRGMISFIENPHKTTIPHEAVHAFMDLMMTPKEKAAVIAEVKRRYAGKNFNDLQAEEQLAEDFAKYYTKQFSDQQAKAPSNKLKQLFDWFIGNLKAMLGNGNADRIEQFYQDVINKKPGILQKFLVRRRIQRGYNDFQAVQLEYYQQPDALTAKFLENVDVKNRETASYQFLKNLVKSKSLPLKDTERDLINDILDTQFKDQKKINMDDFRNAVKSELLPLRAIESSTYADYGASNVNRNFDHEYTTLIFNSPFQHGHSGHFHGDFSVRTNRDDVEIREIPPREGVNNKTRYAVVRKDVVLTEDNIEQNTFTVADTKEQAEQWLSENTWRVNEGMSDSSGYLKTDNKSGLFSHARVWNWHPSLGENFNNEMGTLHVAEIQSDAFQSDRVKRTVKTEEKKLGAYKANKVVLEELQKAIPTLYKENTSDDYSILYRKIEEKLDEIVAANYNSKEYGSYIGWRDFGYNVGIQMFAHPEKDTMSSLWGRIASIDGEIYTQEIVYKEAVERESKIERGFFAYRNVWQERTVRELIRYAAINGFTKVRFPTPYTVAKVEGYLGDDGAPYEVPGGDYETDLSVGESIEFLGDEYIVLDADAYNITVARSSEVESFMENEWIEERVGMDWDDIVLAFDEIEKEFGAIKTYQRAQEVLEKIHEDGSVMSFDSDAVDLLEDMARSRSEDLSIEDFEDDWKDTKIENYEPDFEDLYGTVFYEDLGDGTRRVYYGTEGELQTESLLQPSRYDEVADKEDFDYRDLEDDTNRTVLEFYDKQVNRYLKKLRGTNLREVTDIMDYDWLETDIMPEDKAAVEAFQTKDAVENNRVFSGREVADYVAEVSEVGLNQQEQFDEEPISDYLRGIIERQSFTLQKIKIHALIAIDKDLAEYVENAPNRYEDIDVDAAGAGLPIVVGNWGGGTFGVLDGYNRILTNLEAGNNYIEAYVSTEAPRFQEKPATPPSEEDAENIVKDATVGRKPNRKHTLNVAMGNTPADQITMRETTLLKKKLRDMAKGALFGRRAMRETLMDAFRTKLAREAEIRQAVMEYTKQLPLGERGKLMPVVVNARTPKDLVKAYFRVDAALDRVDKAAELAAVRETASEVRRAIRNGNGIAVEYQRQLIDILNSYDLHKPTAKTIKRLKALRDYVADNPGFVPDHVTKSLDRLTKKPASEMSLEEIRELNSTLNRLIALGHLKLRLRTSYDERQKQAVLSRLLTSTRSLDVKGDPKDDKFTFRESRKMNLLATFHAARVTDMIDGTNDYKGENTAIQKKISRQVQSAELGANRLLDTVLGEIQAIKDDWTDQEQAAMEFYLLVEQGAHTQANELATAMGWTEKPQKTPEMALAMDIMRATFDKYVNHIAAVYEELENKPFEQVDNYFPLKYERNAGEIPEPIIGQHVQRSAKTEQGFTFRRLPNVKKVPRIDVFGQFEEAIREQQYYLYVQPALIEARNLVNDPAYKQLAGRIVTSWWKDYLDGVAHKGQQANSRANVYLRVKRVQLSRAILGYKLSSMLLQPMAIFDALAYVQMRYGQRAAATLLGQFANTWINPRYARRVKEQSPALMLRDGGELAVEEIENMADREKGRFAKAKRLLERGALAPLKWLDIKTAAAVDQAIYKVLRREGLPEDKARTEADFIMNLVSASSEIADRPLVLMRGEVGRTFFTFQTFMLNRWGLVAHDIVMSGLVKGKFTRKAKAIYAMFILGIGAMLEDEMRKKIYEAISGKELPDDDVNLLKAMFKVGLDAIPIIGSIFRGLEYGGGYSIPITRVMQDIAAASKTLTADDPDVRNRGILKIIEGIATWRGVPGSSQAGDIAERVILNTPTRKQPQNGNLPALPDIPALELPPIPELPPLPQL